VTGGDEEGSSAGATGTATRTAAKKSTPAKKSARRSASAKESSESATTTTAATSSATKSTSAGKKAAAEKETVPSALGGRSGSRRPLRYSATDEQGGETTSGATPARKDDWARTPRNAPCPCGSGRKYKLCHCRA